jgi:membrane protease YdiL (CAAX protease family)
MRVGVTSILTAAIPYAAVAAGLYAGRSAWAAILLYHLGIVVALCVGGWRGPLRRAASGWRPAAAAFLAAAAALGGCVLYVLWPHVDATPHGLALRLQEFGLGGWSWSAFAIYYATVHPLLEELFWRGRGLGSGAKSAWWDLAFAGYHVPVLWFFIDPFWITAAFAVLAIASWTWRATAQRLGGLGVPLVSHAAADISVALAASLISRGG